MESKPQISSPLGGNQNGHGPTSANPPLSAVSASFGNDNGNGNGNGSGSGSGSRQGNSDSNGPKSPLSFGFLKNMSFSSDKKVKADGQLPKRRGPKPDSKPALTRRQELNRQAQRTHRERKELYIKALETEIGRLRDGYVNTCRERDAATEENRQLKELLISQGIPLPEGISSPPKDQTTPLLPNASIAPTTGSSPHIATPQATTITYPSTISEDPDKTMLDRDQLGVQFVLALEQPCMDHIQMLCNKSQNTEDGISGHALMATCPPASHMEAHPNEPYPHKMPDLPQTDLLKLLDLSARLPLEGEITPVMAWAIITNDERTSRLTEQEYGTIRSELEAKIRCYGFGAVLEEFEVRDALDRIISLKDGEGPAPVGMPVGQVHQPILKVELNGY